MPTKCKWTHPRTELIEIGVNLARRGYDIAGIAEHITLRHFTGRNYKSAERHLAGAIAHRFYVRHAGRTERQEEIANMAAQLYAEGWQPLFDEGHDNGNANERCFWLHKSTHLSVNSNGGFFHGYAAATRAAYESHVRALLADKEGES